VIHNFGIHLLQHPEHLMNQVISAATW